MEKSSNSEFKDMSIYWSVFFLKAAGMWLTSDDKEERHRRYVYALSAFALIYGIYVNTIDCYYSWGDLSHCIFLINNTLCILLGIYKITILTTQRMEFRKIVLYAQKNFWHSNYSGYEKEVFVQCQKFCKLWLVTVSFLTQASLAGYAITPIVLNIGKNESDRVLPFNMWLDLPLSLSPYYELVFIFQSPTKTDLIDCVNEDYLKLKKCIRDHQALIKFCDMLEGVFSLPILGHMVVFSLLMCFDTYEILLADGPLVSQTIFVFHMVGSFLHIILFTSSCQGLIDESTNVSLAAYSSWWMDCPMNKVGIMLRRDILIILLRTRRPCCLTAGGYFPVSLETSTALMSSTMSYFTLMRESSAKE
ncbi:odorant receptor 49b-like isoform X2 [Ceratina calcarata]|uniref:Odorant receptor n=1 Tax=Ceratina calcarata TaxID=156304 RepID=A0AAJ7S285_9HYME|nr:odorant receptor 49b-like isoform X2 [Ceratina calcarata]